MFSPIVDLGSFFLIDTPQPCQSELRILRLESMPLWLILHGVSRCSVCCINVCGGCVGVGGRGVVYVDGLGKKSEHRDQLD